MRITSVSYGFTKNEGNFQSSRVDCTVELGDHSTDDPDVALDACVGFVMEALDLPHTGAQHEALKLLRSQLLT